MRRQEAEVERKQREVQKPFIITGPGYEQMVERAQEERKGFFINEFLEQKLAELGREKLEKQKQKLTEEGAKLWDRAQQGKRRYFELEEQAGRKIVDWKVLEKSLRLWLENEGKGRGWSKEMIENTVQRELGHFQTAQYQVQERLKAAAYDPLADFRKRMLNPQTRESAIRHFLFDSAEKAYWLRETVKLLFEQLDRLKRR